MQVSDFRECSKGNVCIFVYCPGDHLRANRHNSVYANSFSQDFAPKQQFLVYLGHMVSYDVEVVVTWACMPRLPTLFVCFALPFECGMLSFLGFACYCTTGLHHKTTFSSCIASHGHSFAAGSGWQDCIGGRQDSRGEGAAAEPRNCYSLETQPTYWVIFVAYFYVSGSCPRWQEQLNGGDLLHSSAASIRLCRQIELQVQYGDPGL